MVTDDGERIVGLRVPHELLPGVLEAIQSEHKRMYQIFNQEPAEGTTEMAESHFEPTMRVAGEVCRATHARQVLAILHTHVQ